MRAVARLAALTLTAALAACATQRPVVPQQQPLRLTRVSLAALPGWSDAQFDAARAAFARQCPMLMDKAADRSMGGSGYGGTIADWAAACGDAIANGRDFFARNFRPYAVSAGADPNGLFTGYYEPQLEAAPVPDGIYKTPIYGLPLQTQGVTLPDRATIDRTGIAAPVLLWAADPIALFFMQIQGSGRAHLPDGSVVRLSYAGQNGQPYTAIGRTLIDEGQLTRENVSLQSIRAWLTAHPDQAQRVMETDASYVFFKQDFIDDPALGANGSLGVNLTPLGSLAIDTHLNVLGAPCFVAADGPDPVHALLIAQDTGGAIRGAVRGDIFFGTGPVAETRAGHMNAPGKLFVLLPNALAAKIGAVWQAR